MSCDPSAPARARIRSVIEPCGQIINGLSSASASSAFKSDSGSSELVSINTHRRPRRPSLQKRRMAPVSDRCSWRTRDSHRRRLASPSRLSITLFIGARPNSSATSWSFTGSGNSADFSISRSVDRWLCFRPPRVSKLWTAAVSQWVHSPASVKRFARTSGGSVNTFYTPRLLICYVAIISLCRKNSK